MALELCESAERYPALDRKKGMEKHTAWPLYFQRRHLCDSDKYDQNGTNAVHVAR
jgi:hypothetical protein